MMISISRIQRSFLVLLLMSSVLQSCSNYQVTDKGKIKDMPQSRESSQIKSKFSVVNNYSWDQAKLILALPQPSSLVSSVAFSPDGKYMASTSIAGEIILRRSDTFKLVRRINTDNKETNVNQVQAIIFTSDSKHLVSAESSSQIAATFDEQVLTATGFRSTIKLFDVETGSLVQVLMKDTDPKFIWNHLSLSTDNCILISSSLNGENQQFVKAWDICGEKDGYSTSNSHLGIVSPDGTKMITVNRKEGIVNVVEPKSGKIIHSFPAGDKPISAMSISQDSKLLAVGTEDGDVIVSKVSTGQSIIKLRQLVNKKSDLGRIESVVFNPDGKTLASADLRGNIVVWNWKAGKHLITLRDGKGTVFSIDFSPDGQTLISGGSDYAVKVWR